MSGIQVTCESIDDLHSSSKFGKKVNKRGTQNNLGGFRQSMFSDRGISAGQSRGQFRGESGLDDSFEEEPHLSEEEVKRSNLLNEDGTDLTVE